MAFTDGGILMFCQLSMLDLSVVPASEKGKRMVLAMNSVDQVARSSTITYQINSVLNWIRCHKIDPLKCAVTKFPTFNLDGDARSSDTAGRPIRIYLVGPFDDTIFQHGTHTLNLPFDHHNANFQSLSRYCSPCLSPRNIAT